MFIFYASNPGIGNGSSKNSRAYENFFREYVRIKEKKNKYKGV